MEINDALNEDQIHQKRTYSNYLRFVRNLCDSKNSIYESLLIEVESKHFLVGCLGEYYYNEYIIYLFNNLEKFENITEKYLTINNIIEDDKKMFLFYKEKTENRIIELHKELKFKKELPNSKLVLKDFFNREVNDDIINSIKDKFNAFKNKEMAILIYLLNKNNLIEIDNNNRKEKSRIHFVRSLTGIHYGNIKGVNNYLTSVKGELKKINVEDIQYISIEKQLEKIVSNCQTTSNN